MNFVTYRKTDGRITAVMGVPNGYNTADHVTEDIDVLIVDDEISSDNYKIVAGELVPTEASDFMDEKVQTARRQLRGQVNRLLEQSDWTQAVDAGVDKAAWAIYRKDLRDLLETVPDPLNVTYPTPPDQITTLSAELAKARGKINTTIDLARRQLATDIAFQEEVYHSKREEAVRYLAETPTDLSTFPLLQELTVVRNTTAADLSALWLQMNSNWTPLLNQTEVVREQALVELGSVTDVSEINAILVEVDTALANLGIG